MDGPFGVRRGEATPPAPVEMVEGEGFHRGDDPADSRRIERDQVRVTVEEADIAAVRDDLERVAGEERATALRARHPMEGGAPREMPAAANHRYALDEWLCLSLPEDDGIVGPHHPL